MVPKAQSGVLAPGASAALSEVELPDTVGVSPNARTKLMHVQILRAVAATLVVVDHAISTLDLREHQSTRSLHAGWLLGHFGVSAFFVLSGLLMVRQSSSLFGSAENAALFLWRRVVRIYPIYWIALAATILLFRPAVPRRTLQFVFSLLLVPNLAGKPQLHFAPLLEQGWTLNYEMSFYVFFALCLLLPRRVGLLLLVFVPQILSAVNVLFATSSLSMLSELTSFYVSPLIALFGYGVAIGVFLTAAKPHRAVSFPLSPSLLLVGPVALVLAFTSRWGGLELWELLSVLGVAVVFLCATADGEHLDPVSRLLVQFGDASYSTYLFHILTMSFIYPLYGALTGHRILRSPWLFVLMSIVFCNLAGLGIHVAVERPVNKMVGRFVLEAKRHAKWNRFRMLLRFQRRSSTIASRGAAQPGHRSG